MDPHNHEWVLKPVLRLVGTTIEITVWVECEVAGCPEVLSPEEAEDRLNQHERIVPFEN
jgi:hypothetical protein